MKRIVANEQLLFDQADFEKLANIDKLMRSKDREIQRMAYKIFVHSQLYLKMRPNTLYRIGWKNCSMTKYVTILKETLDNRYWKANDAWDNVYRFYTDPIQRDVPTIVTIKKDETE